VPYSKLPSGTEKITAHASAPSAWIVVTSASRELCSE
jgi:hypothetical protein